MVQFHLKFHLKLFDIVFIFVVHVIYSIHPQDHDFIAEK